MGVPVPHNRGPSFHPAATVTEQVSLVRWFCEVMLALSPEIVALGSYLSEAPMSIVEGLLALLSDPAK